MHIINSEIPEFSSILLILSFALQGLTFSYWSYKQYTTTHMKARAYKEAEQRYHSRRIDILSGKYDKSSVLSALSSADPEYPEHRGLSALEDA